MSEAPNRNGMTSRSTKIAVIVIAVVEAIAMVPLILYLVNK